MRAFVIGLMLACALATPASAQYEHCGEDDIACHELWYWLEETLFLYEQGVSASLDEGARQCFAADIAAWRAEVEASCADDAVCTEAALRQRIASLDPLQPGANAAEGAAMDGVPELAAVLGPEPETGAPASAEPLEASGPLVWAGENPEHMGLAVDAGATAPHVVVFDMEIGSQAGHDALLALAEAATPVRVTGGARVAPDGVANFDTAGCRLVYRLPD
ncbi:hypothetical protein [Devosia geojensis]|nr:hypothetical protein [Devosia geojensis]